MGSVPPPPVRTLSFDSSAALCLELQARLRGKVPRRRRESERREKTLRHKQNLFNGSAVSSVWKLRLKKKKKDPSATVFFFFFFNSSTGIVCLDFRHRDRCVLCQVTFLMDGKCSRELMKNYLCCLTF